MLRAAYIGWENCEYGAPAIDCKRPYGNSSVVDDIREILNRPYLTTDECAEFHAGTQQALQIILYTGKFEPGVYKSVYGAKWDRYD